MYLVPDIYVLFDLYRFVYACVDAVFLIYSLYKEKKLRVNIYTEKHTLVADIIRCQVMHFLTIARIGYFKW